MTGDDDSEKAENLTDELGPPTTPAASSTTETPAPTPTSAPSSPTPPSSAAPPASINRPAPARPAHPPAAAKPALATGVSAATATKPAATAKPSPPPPPPYQPIPSLPLSMIDSPADANEISNEVGAKRFPGELEDDFDTVLLRVEIAPRNRPLMRLLARPLTHLLPRRMRARFEERIHTERHVAFDGFRSDFHDDKTERDRRYGTVYTVSEEVNAYLVRLEFPRILPNSALKRTWRLPDAMPDYDYAIGLGDAVLTIRAGVRGEAYRRLSYVSASFPSDFLTRIEFEKPVSAFKHRLRNKVLEIVVFKRDDEGLERAA